MWKFFWADNFFPTLRHDKFSKFFCHVEKQKDIFTRMSKIKNYVFTKFEKMWKFFWVDNFFPTLRHDKFSKFFCHVEKQKYIFARMSK
jgi:hypothetical protein